MTEDEFFEGMNDLPGYDNMSDNWFDDMWDKLAEIFELGHDMYGDDWDQLEFDSPEFWEAFAELYDTLYG